MKYFNLPIMVLTALLAIGCTPSQKDLYDEDAVIKRNALNILGTIDSRQDWSSINQGTVTVTANADLDDIVKVQILTESPFLNNDTRVLSEAAVAKGGKVTLNYDAPNVYSQLIAACVSSKGVYYIQVFKVGQTEVSFSHGAKARTTRAAGSEAPTFTSIVLAAPQKSFNAMRAEAGNSCVIKGKTYTEWADGSWAGEQMWQPADGNVFDNGWKMDTEKNRGIIYRDLDGFAEGEMENLKAIADAFLYKTANDKYSVNGKKNNIRVIRNSAVFTTNNNYVYTDGKTPLTLIPVQIYTTEFKMNHVYYYYYKPENIPSGMNEVDYIKTLPKYKAIQVERATTTADSKAGKFFRNKEFLLPYYGDGQPTQGQNVASAIFPKGYRVGFLNMKHNNNDYSIANCLYGCTYGDGRLNYAVNHIEGHYLTAMDKAIGGSTVEGMQFTDPRIAIFTANNKTYMCFEDGADCNFCDMIIEIGGGTDILEEPIQPEAAAYTMCFEDELDKADYDMNDLVLQAIRVSDTQIQLAIIACGGNDALKLNCPNSKLLTMMEVHQFFGITPGDRFINTEKDKQWFNPMSEVITVDKSMRIEDFLKSITVTNLSTNKTIGVPKEKGQPPYAIIVPINFQYPLEGHRITSVYTDFLNWAHNINQAGDWYLFGLTDQMYPDMMSLR